jgi:phosphoribosylglycinamide formyltransferase-1
MHVGLISYQVGHRKTLRLAHVYRLKGHRVTIYGFPFMVRPQQRSRRFQERPDQIVDIDVEAVCRRYGFAYRPMNGWSETESATLNADSPDVFVTCIAKIIPAFFLAGHRFLNSHPGLLPQNRGVDSFKWAIVNGWPIGVTLHLIDAQIDAGQILRRERVPIYRSDSLGDVAARAYELECDLLGNFDIWLHRAGKWPVDPNNFALSKRRIPADADAGIAAAFAERRMDFIDLSTDFSVHPHPSDFE